jgi:hypothetical protein
VPVMREGSVVRDAPGAHVDAVVGEPEARRNEVRAQRRLFTAFQPSVVATEPAKNRTPASRESTMGSTRNSCAPPRPDLRDSWIIG